ncbi:MAG: NUDIX hydrolase [bacterium]
MDDYYRQLPRKSMAAGALVFNATSELLIVKPSYMNDWSIPGGVVEENESPRNACIREIKEEVGIVLGNILLLCVDYMSSDVYKSESLQFIFYGGVLSEVEVRKITTDGEEIVDHRFVDIETAVELLGGPTKGLARRLQRCMDVVASNRGIYLENGA